MRLLGSEPEFITVDLPEQVLICCTGNDWTQTNFLFCTREKNQRNSGRLWLVTRTLTFLRVFLPGVKVLKQHFSNQRRFGRELRHRHSFLLNSAACVSPEDGCLPFLLGHPPLQPPLPPLSPADLRIQDVALISPPHVLFFDLHQHMYYLDSCQFFVVFHAELELNKSEHANTLKKKKGKYYLNWGL